MITEAIYEIVNKRNLTIDKTKQTMNEIMDGIATDAQIASFLTALRFKGETIEEITACAMVMREKCQKLNPKFDVLDIVGTGGDELATFNISSISSLVVAAAGVPVAKHGNRSASSKCGSADLFEALGVNIMLTPNQCEEVLEKTGICFLMAQTFHSLMKYVSKVRKELGIRTIFNILGPLANPARANYELMGVADENLVKPIANVLANLGVKRAMVVHGHDGLDEVTLSDSTTVCEVNDGKTNSFFITPEQFGLKRCKLSKLIGGSPEKNKEIALNILNGEHGAKRDTVVLNSAVCLYMFYNNVTLRQCTKMAQDVIDSKKAINKLNDFIKISNSFIYEVCMILNKIVVATRIRVAKEKSKKSFDTIKKEALSITDTSSYKFEKALSKLGINFVCEIKKASPLKGLISNSFNYKKIVLEYQNSGAAAISVLTEPSFFLGSKEHLKEIKNIVSIPVLRKDFVIDSYQIYESKIIGADAILLICAILDKEVLKDFFEIASSLGLSCIVEVHDEKEIETALNIDAKIIGVNNRNLKNFEVDFNNSIKLRRLVPDYKIFVSASGIKTKEHVDILKANNVNAVLIGEELMKSDNINLKLKELMSRV
jgi:anthranilate phosphoribosyltransferase